jgi:tryptophanyl-tRNA synthetase
MKLRAIAIAPGFAGNNVDLGRRDLAQPRQRLNQNLLLRRELPLIGEVLIVTPATLRKVGALGVDAIGRRLNKRAVVPFLAGQRERDELHFAVDARQTVAAVNQLFNNCQVSSIIARARTRLRLTRYDEGFPLMRVRVFSGVQPTGNLHIGNYLGALKNWAAIQHNYDSIFCIVDLHAITLYQDPAALREKIRETAALFLACGIDPEHSSVIVQSQVSGHAELAWMLTCVTPVGWLERMTQYKAKAAAQETVGDGLLQYPVLMAADILLYQAGIVPVGDDQSQHLELTRDIAQRFNSLYGETFVIPETKLPLVGARIMGLDEPDKKMSKSATGANHSIGLLDPIDQIRKKVMRATTDSNPAVAWETMGPGVANLISIYRAFGEVDEASARAEFEGLRYGDLKKKVASMVIDKIEPIQQRFREITADASYLDSLLARSHDRIAPIAQSTVELVKARMGLYTR